MAENRLIIGSLPVLRGAYDSATNYYRDNQVTMYGSTFQSLADENMGYPPAELREDGKVYAINTDKWIIVANAIDAYNAGERIAALEDTFSHQDNEEFAYVVTDADGKVLFGIKADGSPYYPNNEMYRVIQNDEYLAAWVDESGKLLFGLKADGSVYIAKSEYIDAVKEIQAKIESLSESVQPLTDTFSIVSNDEWLHAVVDAEGKLLFGIKAENGEVVMPKQDTYKVVSNDEWLAAWLDSQDRILFGVKADGTFWAAKSNFAGGGNYDEQIAQLNEEIQQLKDQIQATASDVFSVIDDAEERLSVTTDKDGRVISYRNKDGVLHEKKGVDTSKYYLNGEEKDFTDRSEIAGEVTKAAENGAVKLENVDGVSNHNTPNLLIASEMQKTFNDGKNSFTPPNEGYEMSNPIECQAGDWFTRTGTATGMVVVTDENDKNGTRLFNADGTTLGNTFQIPTDMTWVRYIRMAADVTGASDGSVVICKGKVAYTAEDRGDYVTVEKLRVGKRNLSKDVMYVKSEDGTKFYELYVDTSGTLQVREVDPDVIPENEYPLNWIPFTLTGSFIGFDRMCIQNSRCLIELKATGPTKICAIGYASGSSYANFEHFYKSSGEGRYVMNFGTNASNQVTKGSLLTIYDDNFNIIEEGINGGDIHDFVYIDDDHLILLSARRANVVISDVGEKEILGIAAIEMKKINGRWTDVGHFYSTDYPELCTDAFGNLGDVIVNHQNTVELDYDGNLILNARNWDTWMKIKRTENSDGTVTLGSKTLDYDEAIIGRVGGRHNSGYLDNKRVLNDGFSFVDAPASLNEVSDDDWEEWQWFHCHDVKYWGMKQIGDKQYPTYTLFDNNMWTNNTNVDGTYNVVNKHNNKDINPNDNSDRYYLESKDNDSQYKQYTNSRVVQMSIDWENHKVMDYRVYYIPQLYSREQGGATMHEEGIISIAYSYAGIFGLWDFTTEETEVSGHIYKGAKQLFLGKYENYNYCYRANTYKLNV